MPPGDRLPDADPGRAGERTRLAWARTSLAFGAVGAVMLRKNLVVGAIVLGIVPLIWGLGHVASRRTRPGPAPGRLLLVTVIVTGVALLAAAVALVGPGPASLRQLLPLHG